MSWVAFNFECTSVAARRDLLEWFERNHEVERRRANSSLAPLEPRPAGDEEADDDAGDGGGGRETDREYEVRDGDGPAAEIAADVVLSVDGDTYEGEIVWLDRYCYLTVDEDPGPLLEASASQWDRAVKANVEPGAGGVRLAILYTTIGSHAVETVRFQGRPQNAGVDVMYIFAMEHQFRFRTYADILPTICSAPFPSAFHTPDATDPESEMFQDMAEMTGVDRTSEGIRLFQTDPMIAEEDRPELRPREQFQQSLRARLIRPLKAAVTAAKAKL